MFSPKRGRFLKVTLICALLAVLLHDDGVESRRNRSASEDANRNVHGSDEGGACLACGYPSREGEMPRSVAGKVSAPDRIAVHR